MSRVGLSEAWCYLKTPMQLSDGQRWRLRLALAQHRAGGNGAIFCDEFAALLDRLTARIVARALRRCISESTGLRAVLACGHDDLIDALHPDRVVRCDFGQTALIRPAVSLSFPQEAAWNISRRPG